MSSKKNRKEAGGNVPEVLSVKMELDRSITLLPVSVLGDFARKCLRKRNEKYRVSADAVVRLDEVLQECIAGICKLAPMKDRSGDEGLTLFPENLELGLKLFFYSKFLEEFGGTITSLKTASDSIEHLKDLLDFKLQKEVEENDKRAGSVEENSGIVEAPDSI